jgi:hypothetical protein
VTASIDTAKRVGDQRMAARIGVIEACGAVHGKTPFQESRYGLAGIALPGSERSPEPILKTSLTHSSGA